MFGPFTSCFGALNCIIQFLNLKCNYIFYILIHLWTLTSYVMLNCVSIDLSKSTIHWPSNIFSYTCLGVRTEDVQSACVQTKWFSTELNWVWETVQSLLCLKDRLVTLRHKLINEREKNKNIRVTHQQYEMMAGRQKREEELHNFTHTHRTGM